MSTSVLHLALAAGLLMVTTGTGQGTPEVSTMIDRNQDTRIVFDFGPDEEPWTSIDDPVMGGRSRSSMRLEEGIAVFEGVVSLENNGGFASVRSRPATHDLSRFDGIRMRVRGDGNAYGFRLRTSAGFDGVSYEEKMETEADRWIEVELPFREVSTRDGSTGDGRGTTFRPVFRGRVVRDYPDLDPAAIQTFGLIIFDKQEGPFRLEIDCIEAYSRDDSPDAE